MRLKVLWVGKTREAFVVKGIEKYLKLLRPFAKVEVVEIKEEKGTRRDDNLRKEGRKILAHSKSYVLLDEGGRQMSSTALATMLGASAGTEFVLGGPYGVSDEVRAGAAGTLGLSKMTLTHEMARLLLLEQLYRATQINRGGRYHH